MAATWTKLADIEFPYLCSGQYFSMASGCARNPTNKPADQCCARARVVPSFQIQTGASILRAESHTLS